MTWGDVNGIMSKEKAGAKFMYSKISAMYKCVEKSRKRYVKILMVLIYIMK